MTRSLPPLALGGDYNPEQWPDAVRREDVDLMQRAGVDLVTLGVFSWAHLEPEQGRFEFGWLDEAVERLHAGGVRIDMATATASPPMWLSAAHPEMLPVTADGTTLWPGGRQAYCPSSPVYRERASALCRAMGERYPDHPAVVLWHVSNEIGCHNARCYCDVSAAAFRRWLRAAYAEDLDALNDAWGTAFWSQRYTDWEQILPPRSAPAFPNPTQQLDFARFSSDELLGLFTMERDILHEVSPGVPVTTNFMVMQHTRDMDYFRWAQEVDVVSNDHYLMGHLEEPHRELAFSADWTRGVAGGRPWLLMEHSTSAVNWQPRNIAKRPGELVRTSLSHVARGADAVLYFQWRQSRAGAEKYHSALVPHAGTDSRVWQEVCELSGILDCIEEVAGSGADNRVAMVLDWNARWACELDSHPSQDVKYLDRAEALHRSLVDLGVGVDVVHPGADLAAYDLLVVPTLTLVTDEHAASIEAAVRAGASVVVTYFSGIVDEHDHVRLGGYPGAFREMLGVRVEEFTPLGLGESVRLDDGSAGDLWTEDLALSGAETIASYVDGPVPGRPAITRHDVGEGTAWYVATRLEQAATDALVARIVEEAGVRPVASGEPGVERVRRVAGDGRSWVFVLNHLDRDVEVGASGHDLVSGEQFRGRVAAGGVAVVRES